MRIPWFFILIILAAFSPSLHMPAWLLCVVLLVMSGFLMFIHFLRSQEGTWFDVFPAMIGFIILGFCLFSALCVVLGKFVF